MKEESLHHDPGRTTPLPYGPTALERSRALYYPAASLQPLQFPSLQHLVARLERACATALGSEGLSRKTIAGYRYAYGQLVVFLQETQSDTRFIGGHADAQRDILRAWIGWLRERGANHTTVNHYWRGLHAVVARVARDDGVLDPTALVPPPRPGRPAPRFLPRASLAEVFTFVRNVQWPFGQFERARNVALIAVMALGGLRLGEVLRLDTADVDLTEERVLVRRGKGRYGGKDRVVYLSPPLHAALDAYATARRKRRPATPRFFLSTRGDRAIADVTIRRLCRIVTVQAKIRISPHMLRHTCATLMRQSGIPDRLAMEQLGHSSLHILQRYSHVESGERQRELRRLTIDVDIA